MLHYHCIYFIIIIIVIIIIIIIIIYSLVSELDQGSY